MIPTPSYLSLWLNDRSGTTTTYIVLIILSEVCTDDVSFTVGYWEEYESTAPAPAFAGSHRAITIILSTYSLGKPFILNIIIDGEFLYRL